jgi:hypothetical protein
VTVESCPPQAGGDVAGGAPDERVAAVVAADVAAAAQRLERLEAARRHGFDPEREADISRARERLDELQAEFVELRRQADEEAALEREQKEAAKAAERRALEKRRPELEQRARATRWAVEQAIGQLVDAIEAATSAGSELERVDQELERPRDGLHRARSAIENRLARRLAEIGIRDLGVPLGNGGREPLAKKPQNPRR